MLLLGSIVLLAVSLYKYMSQEEEKILYDAVLVYFVKDDQVLLAMKMKKIGKGKLNGYGGGIEDNETPRQAAVREVEEETGVIIRAEDLEEVAEMYFKNHTESGETFVCKVYVYLCRSWEGNFVPTEEMADPAWFPTDSLPFERMMPDDPHWLPHIFSGKKIIGRAELAPRQSAIIGKVEITEVASLSD